MASRIARGDIRLYQFAPPDKKRPAVVLTRNSAIAYLSTVNGRAHNIHDPWCAIGSGFECRGWHEDSLRRESP